MNVAQLKYLEMEHFWYAKNLKIFIMSAGTMVCCLAAQAKHTLYSNLFLKYFFYFAKLMVAEIQLDFKTKKILESI